MREKALVAAVAVIALSQEFLQRFVVIVGIREKSTGADILMHNKSFKADAVNGAA